MSTRAAAPAAVEWADPARRLAFEAWLASLPAERLQPASLRPASADASFRRYLRVDTADGASRIVMDAPPPQEDVRPFVQIAQLIGQAGLNAPRVLAQDVAHGFLLLTDLGTEPYLATLQQALAGIAPAGSIDELGAQPVAFRFRQDGNLLPGSRAGPRPRPTG